MLKKSFYVPYKVHTSDIIMMDYVKVEVCIRNWDRDRKRSLKRLQISTVTRKNSDGMIM